MGIIFGIAQIVISIILLGLILIQSQGGGLGEAFGQSTLYSSKRGMEKFIFLLTIIFAFLFIILSLVVFLNQ